MSGEIPLCAMHAESWFCERNHWPNPDAPCILCAAQPLSERVQAQLENVPYIEPGTQTVGERERLIAILRVAAAKAFADPIMNAANWPETKERMGVAELFVLAATEELMAAQPAGERENAALRKSANAFEKAIRSAQPEMIVHATLPGAAQPADGAPEITWRGTDGLKRRYVPPKTEREQPADGALRQPSQQAHDLALNTIDKLQDQRDQLFEQVNRYEREYILPTFTWAKEYGIDLQKLVIENAGHNCVELLVRALAAQTAKEKVLERISSQIRNDGRSEYATQKQEKADV